MGITCTFVILLGRKILYFEEKEFPLTESNNCIKEPPGDNDEYVFLSFMMSKVYVEFYNSSVLSLCRRLILELI